MHLASAEATLVPASHEPVVAASYNTRSGIRAIGAVTKSPVHSIRDRRAIAAVSRSVSVAVLKPPVTPIGSYVTYGNCRSAVVVVVIANRITVVIANGITVAIAIGVIIVAVAVVRCRERRTDKGSRRESDTSAAPSPTSVSPAAMAPTATADVPETSMDAKPSGLGRDA